MKIYNQMEDIVLERVNEIFQDKSAKGVKELCTCSQCRSDVACFVLNRIKPLYMISGRGLAHLQMNYQEKLQREADLVSLIHSGIEHVTKARRPDFSHKLEEIKKIEESEPVPKGYFYNFPQITGRLFNSVNFEPICSIQVTLLHDGKPVKMVDFNWQNPYTIVSNTAGVFSFWPYPESADEASQKLNHELEITVDDKNYEPFRHYFNFMIEAGESFLSLGSAPLIHTVKDLYLNPVR